MEVDKVCNKCGKVVRVDGTNIMQRNLIREDRKEITFTFCICTHCNEIVPLQLDDTFSNADLRRLTSLIARRVKNARAGQKRDLNTDTETKNRIEKRLRKRRECLIKESEGKAFYKKNGEIFIESLDF